MIGDRGYDADSRVRDVLQKAGKTAMIPPKSRRNNPEAYVCDRGLYKKRHRIENFFSRLKEFRSSDTQREKNSRNFLAGVYLTAQKLWLS